MSTADNRVHWLARVFAIAAALPLGCGEPAPGPTRDELLARATALDGDPAAALVQLPRAADPTIARRRADLLDRLGRTAEARDEIALALALAPDAALLAQSRLLRASLAARAAATTDLSRVFDAAPITEHPALAHRAASDASLDQLAAIAPASPELARAAGTRLEDERGPAAALGAREQLVAKLPDDADAWDAVARSRIAAGQVDAALDAWDRAASIAIAQDAFRVAPIRALVIAGESIRATQRARDLARSARRSPTTERLIAASAGAAAAGDAQLAVALAREAQALRPTDGRLQFLVAQRLAESGDKASAARAYHVLLVCGAHGRAWHRHEVAAKLTELRDELDGLLDEKLPCDPVEAADLATYTTVLRANR